MKPWCRPHSIAWLGGPPVDGTLSRNLDGCEEINLPFCTTGNHGAGLGFRNANAVLPQTLNVQLDCTLDAAHSCVKRLASGDTTWKIGNRGSPIAAWILVDSD